MTDGSQTAVSLEKPRTWLPWLIGGGAGITVLATIFFNIKTATVELAAQKLASDPEVKRMVSEELRDAPELRDLRKELEDARAEVERLRFNARAQEREATAIINGDVERALRMLDKALAVEPVEQAETGEQ